MDRRTDYETLDEALIPHRHSRKPIMRIGMRAQFYFPNGPAPQVRVAAMDALAAYAGLAGLRVTHILPNGSKRLAPLARADFPARQRRQAAEAEPGKVFGIMICEDQKIPHWSGVAQLIGGYAPDRLSYFLATVPASFMKEDPDRYVAAAVEWGSILKPDYGTAGFALVSEPGMELQWPDESWPILSRFRGLDFLGAFNLKTKPDHIQAVNWLTVLGDAALAAVGGRERLEARLAQAWSQMAPAAPGFTLHDFDGGIIVRAGHLPQMGDLENEGVPETYRAASVALRPIIYTGYRDRVGDLLKLPAKLDRHRETLDWIFRFDPDGRPAPAMDQAAEIT